MPTFFSTADLAHFRRLALSAMPYVAHHYRSTPVEDAELGKTAARVLLARLPCRTVSRLRVGRDSEPTHLGEQMTGVIIYTLHLPFATEVQIGDEFEVYTDRGDLDGTFLATLPAQHRTYDYDTTVQVSRVDPPPVSIC